MDNKSICTTCGNGFLNKYLLNEHNRKYHTFKECDGFLTTWNSQEKHCFMLQTRLVKQFTTV